MNIEQTYLNIISEQSSAKTPLKASDLIKILQDYINTYGDLEVSKNTEDGASFTLYNSDDVINVVTGTAPDGSEVKWFEI